MSKTVPDKPTAAQIHCIRRAAGQIPGEDVWTSRPDVMERCEVAGWIDREPGDGQWFATPAGLAAIDPDERREVPAAEVKPGQHVADDAIVGEIALVEHATPYTDHGHDMVALLVTPLSGDVPQLLRPHAAWPIRLATDAEIEAHRAGDRRRELAAALVDLAERIERDRLPVPKYHLNIGGCVGSRADVERWAEFLGVQVTPGGTDGRIPVAERSIEVNGGPSLEVHFQGPTEAEPIQASTGATSPSVAGAVGVTAPSGPEGRDSGPDTPEHRHAGAWKGTEPGSCGVECACGTTYDGFDSLAEAGALLDRHIARETAGPMADCTEPATQRIRAFRPEGDGADGPGYGRVYTCEAHRPEALAALLTLGLKGRTDQLVVNGQQCGHQSNYVNPGAPLLDGSGETAAGDGTPEVRPSYDPNPTIDGRNPDQAYAEYADRLDEWAPGWYRDDQSRMATGLAREASNRLAREAEQNGSGQ